MMPPERARGKKRGPSGRVPGNPDRPEDRAQQVTCPGCGARAELADHTCPHCGQLFYERPGGHVGREHEGKPARVDPDIKHFARRMEEMEKWTRVICTIAGVIFGLLALLFLIMLFRFPLIGTRVAIAGAFFFLVLAIACLCRGLGRRDADVDGVGR